MMKLVKILWLLILPLQLPAQMPDFQVFTPELAGTMRLGLVKKNESIWLSDCKKVQIQKIGHETIYNLKHEWLSKGFIRVSMRSLLDTQGFILKIESSDIPADVQLFWAFGGCLGETVIPAKNKNLLIPEYCKDNVFSVEGNSFTVYYGTSRRLRIFEALVPQASEIRLSDAHQQETPLSFFSSGKKTDAPALSAISPLKNGEAVYFCFYKQNPKADYNYFMLPELYKTGSYEVHSEAQWMKSTPD